MPVYAPMGRAQCLLPQNRVPTNSLLSFNSLLLAYLLVVPIRAKVIFGLNALSGRSIKPNGEAIGAWDYTNAESFIRFTAQNNHTIDGWELGKSPDNTIERGENAHTSLTSLSWFCFFFPRLGNELSGSGVGARVAANQYAMDTIALRNIVNRVYKNVSPMPLVIGPGGFFEAAWFTEYLNKTANSLDATTRHIYNLGPGNLNPQLFWFFISFLIT